MALKNPKEKGNNFERKIAKMFSEWAGVKFIRTPMSGAIHNFKDKRVVSDIVPSLSLGNFPFSIECKNVNCSWEISKILEGTSVTLGAHWEQCRNDAELENLHPWLIFTKNFRRIYSVMYKDDFELIKSNFSNYIEITLSDLKPIAIFDFQEFLEKISISCFQKIFSSFE